MANRDRWRDDDDRDRGGRWGGRDHSEDWRGSGTYGSSGNCGGSGGSSARTAGSGSSSGSSVAPSGGTASPTGGTGANVSQTTSGRTGRKNGS